MDKLRACVRRELVFLALGAMEVCIITPLFAALLSLIIPVRPLPITSILLGTVLAIHYLARAGLRLPLHPLLRSGLLGAAILVSGLLVIHQLLHAQTYLWDPSWLVSIFRSLRQENLSRNVSIFLLVLFLWWRGLVLAQRRLDSESVAFRFRLGVVMLAVTTAVGGFILPWPLHYFVFAFFFVSLLGIALARADEVGQQYGGSQSPFGPEWLATLLIASLVVLLLAAGVAALLTGENVNRFVGPLWEVVRIAAIGVAYVLGWVVQIVVIVLYFFFREIKLEGLKRGLAPLVLPEPEVQPWQSPFTAEQLALFRTAGVILGALFLVLLVAFSLRRLRARAGRRRDEERESVWQGAHLGHGMRDSLRGGRRRLNEAAAALGRLFAALTIRRIYAHMSALAAERGYPRAPHETPYEYLPMLEQSFPDSREEVVRITEAYVAVHYGEVPERPKDVETIRAAWEHVRETAAG